MHCVNKIMRQS